MKFRYPGIQSFSQAEEALFFGRKNDAEKFFQLLRLEQLAVLYGKSGYGKTSLLQAAILPRVERETDYRPIKVRFFGYNAETGETPLSRTVERLDEWLASAAPEAAAALPYLDQLLPTENSLWYQVKRLQAATGHKRFVLVFDQFEEIFTYPEPAVLQFRAQLADLLYVQIPQHFRNEYNRRLVAGADPLGETDTDLFFSNLEVRALFSIRSDYMHLMNRLKDYLPNILRHCYELDALTREQAWEAITGPAAFEPAFAYAADMEPLLLGYLSNQGRDKIESFQLQLICRHIEETMVLGRSDRHIEAADFGATEAGQYAYLREINRNYYLDCIGKLPEDKRAVARLIVERELVTPEDKRRITADAGMLVSRYRDQGATPELLEQLKQTYLIRAEATPRGAAYELSHDALVEPILKVRAEAEKIEAVQRAREAERKMREETKRREEAERLQREAEQGRKRARRRTWVAVIVAIIAIGLGVVAWRLRQQAFRAEITAKEQLLNALKEKSSRLDVEIANAERALKVYKKVEHKKLIETTNQEIKQLQGQKESTSRQIENINNAQ